MLRLAGHYGREVEIDLCAGCHLVWFDRIEAARLSGPGLLGLIEGMAEAQALAHRTLTPEAACPRCAAGLKTVHNRSRWGRSLMLECLAEHGAYQSFAEFLGEKGLLRPMRSVDHELLRRRGVTPACVNCGAPLAGHDTACGHCRSVPSLFDVARLAAALDPEGATAGAAVHDAPARRGALQCLACGQAQDDGEPALQCAQCGSTLAVGRLAEVHAELARLGPALRAHAQRPAPHVRRQRMAAQEAALARERALVAQWRAENDAQMGHHEPPEVETNLTGWPWVAVLALLGWLFWKVLGAG